MYYLEMIQRFWEFNKAAKITPTEVFLYLYLLKIGYDNNRYDFKISDMELGSELGLARGTIRSTKEKLKDRGLVKFQTSNSHPCHYRLVLDYPFFIEPAEKKEIQNSTAQKLPPQIENQNKENGNIPSWEEFIGYAETLEGYESKMGLLIRKKYESWISKGWKNSSDRRIINWKSTLKSLLPYIKKLQGRYRRVVTRHSKY
ncbi:hypothetical protein [Epilithonimonas sp.]|uniref:hypothetical protein n=1 Tax=Epilithonimonas sp. TaxID=2894511 RepID=UPI0028A29B98|nr:hypothetical protein [Epilithonimonas sp.]